MFVVMIASAIVQYVLRSRFTRYSNVPTPNGMTGADVARKMLNDNGIYDVRVSCIKGQLTDHYNPAQKLINLSEAVYNSASIAAVAVAAHETGHAIQHAKGYAPLALRSSLIPVVNFANMSAIWVILAGMLLIRFTPTIMWLGIALFGVGTLFSFVTLPVEINASKRAVTWLRSTGITDERTSPMAVDALKWAAYTYVIAALGSLAQLLYLISAARRD